MVLCAPNGRSRHRPLGGELRFVDATPPRRRPRGDRRGRRPGRAAQAGTGARRETARRSRRGEAAARRSEAAAEPERAPAERDVLDDRERAMRAVEKELAALRVQLEGERRRPGTATETRGPTKADAPAPAAEGELRRLGAR